MRLNIPILTAGLLGTIIYLIMKTRKKHTPDYNADVIIDLEPLPVDPIDSVQQVKTLNASATNYEKEDEAPYDIRGFGIDSHRNTDSNELEDYLNLPLVGSGKTYNNMDLADIDIDTIAKRKLSTKYKYIRLHVKETRDNTDNVSIGHVCFYDIYGEKIDSNHIHIWNPHTGEKTAYKGEWSDNDMKTIIFCFSKAIQISRYDIKTSYKSPANDPSLWTLEGSKNGSFWVPIHIADEDLPVLRGKIMYFDKFINPDAVL
jgi:hypothetical protein